MYFYNKGWIYYNLFVYYRIDKQLTNLMKEKVYIYESPDCGKTIYRREFGSYVVRELIKGDELDTQR